MPDYGAKQGALSVSLLVLGEDSSWTGHTAVTGCSAPDTQASNKTAGLNVCFCVCVNVCLVGVSVPVWVAHVRSCPITNMCA